MNKVKEFLRRKNIVFSVKRYFIDAMGAMAQGLFCTLLVDHSEHPGHTAQYRIFE